MVALHPAKSQKHITSLSSFQRKRPLDSNCLQYEVGSTENSIFAERVGMVTLQVRSSEAKSIDIKPVKSHGHWPNGWAWSQR